MHWKSHKKTCDPEGEKKKRASDKEYLKHFAAQLGVEGKPKVKGTPRSAWSSGFPSEEKKFEWFVDCYRMRVDDDCQWGGIKRGLYAGQVPGAAGTFGRDTPSAGVAADLAVFAKLAALREVVPVLGWDWGAFLARASGLVSTPFSKQDAKAKYGREDVFDVTIGGRSLRYTAEFVYVCAVNAQQPDAAREALARALGGGADAFESAPENVFDDIGGRGVWLTFLRQLHEMRRL